MSYSVFTRNWWKPNPSWPNGLEPDSTAKKHWLAHDVATEAEAREICQDYNAAHEPGRLSRKAEYQEN